MFYFTYITQNKIDKRKYFGIHKTPNIDDGYLGSGTRLHKAITKYGKENFEVIERIFYQDYDELLNAEREFVTEEIVTDVNWYNLKTGGIGGTFSEESRRKMSVSGKERAKNETLDAKEARLAKAKETYIGNDTEERRRRFKERGRKIDTTNRQNNVGIYGISPERRKEIASMGGQKASELGKGFKAGHASDAGRKGGKVSGSLAYENKTGIHSLTPQQEYKRKLNLQSTKALKAGKASPISL